MELENKVTLSTLVDNVPTDVSGKWVKKEDLYPFASAVADYVLSRIENKILFSIENKTNDRLPDHR